MSLHPHREFRVARNDDWRPVWDAMPRSAAGTRASRPHRNYVELKTSAELRPHHKGDAAKFETKLLKYWIQSFLLGVPKIIVGFRTVDMHGRLVRVQEIATTGIPKLVRETGNRSWDNGVCINFAHDFLRCMS